MSLENSFSLSRFSFLNKKLKSPIWLGGRVLSQKISKTSLKIEVFGQGNIFILKEFFPLKFYKKSKALKKNLLKENLMALKENQKSLGQIKYKKGAGKNQKEEQGLKEQSKKEKLKKNQNFYDLLFSVQVGDLILFLVHSDSVTVRKNHTFLVSEVKGIRILFRKKKSQFNSYFSLNSSSDSPISFDVQKAQKWNDFIREVRLFFNQLGLIEVQTPSLVQSPGVESTLHPFSLKFEWGSKRAKLFLPTSPELHLKKLLCKDWSDIFEIKNCFRNSELSSLHEPEFWMLEWYRAFSNLNQIEKDLKGLLKHLKKKNLLKGPLPILKKISISELFKKYLNFSLHPETSLKKLRELVKQKGLRGLDSYSWSDVFHLIFIERIEPHLKKGAYMIYNYPPQLAALSRLNSSGWAMRFEFYWKGFEIANAFDELTDANEHIKRLEREEELRKKEIVWKKFEKIPRDKSFLFALKNGMPPSGGIALGLDRLFLACQKLKTLKEIRPFSIQDQLT